MALFKIDGQKLTAIADAIRAYTGSEATMTPDEMAVRVESVHAAGYTLGLDQGLRDGQALGRQEGYADGKTAGIEEGKQEEYDRFWDAYQRNGRPTFLGSMFAGPGWTSKTFYPKYNIVSDAYGCASMFYMFDYIGRNRGNPPLNLEERLNELGITIDLSRSFSPSNMFQQANISVVPALDFSTFTGMGYVFYGADRVVTIRKLKVNENASWSNAFTSATALENIAFEGTIGKSISFADSPKLTNASVQSIIDCLKDLTGATTQTLTVHQDVRNKMTPDQVDTIVNVKNWTLAPAASTS